MAPWLSLRSKAFSHGCNEEQHGLHAFHESQPAQSNRVNSWGTQQLCSSTQVDGVIRMLPQAKRDAKLLVGQCRMIRRKVLSKIPFVMDGATFDCAFEEPFTYLLFLAAAQPAHFTQQNGNMRGIAQLLGERQWLHMFRYFHVPTLRAK